MKDVCCMKLGREAASGKGELVIVPTAIVYTNKSSYRSLLCIFSSFLSISDSAFDTVLGAISPIRISTTPSFLEGNYRAVVKITTTPIEKDSVSTSMTGIGSTLRDYII